jgi:hypothetical protein
MSTIPRSLALALLLTTVTGVAFAQDLAVKPGGSPLPGELADPIRTALVEPSTTVTRGEAAIEIWWAKQLPTKPGASGAPAWAGIADGALVGAVRIAAPLPDIRGVSIKPGVYTLRYAMQPQDGDHMGASPFREFLLVSQAALDTTAEPLGYKGAVALAKKTGSKPHPASLSLDPPAAAAEPGTIVTNEAGHKAVVFRVPVAGGGQLTFGVVLVGLVEHQM